MGVWIEIHLCHTFPEQTGFVTPCVGVWIEIVQKQNGNRRNKVTPCVGVWIEINTLLKNMA